MEKKYKSGLVLGKFFPPHRGHLYLIDTAIENCELVHVIVCNNINQYIPGELRVKTLNEIYKDKNVIIHSMNDIHLPQHDYECNSLDEFYTLWIPEVYKLIDKIDCVFTSETYGDDFAKYLGVEHFLLDIERKKYPISGTKIRSNPFDTWEFIPKEIKPFFVKRIAIMGPESVGKSVMTKKLATYFNTNFLVEYGRLVYENNGNKVGIKDFIPISEGRQSLEDWTIKESNKLLFCDTEDITTYIFSKMYCPDEYKQTEEYFLNVLKTKPKYDLYLLLKPDCKSKQDGTRNFLKERDEHYDVIKSELIKYGCNFFEISGTKWESRLNDCVTVIKSELL